MKMKRTIATSLLVSLLILSTAGSVLIASSHSGFKSIIVSPIRENTIAQYQRSEPLLVTSNADFALLGATGVGTPSDPYTFENLQISSNNTCIMVQNTNAYFVVSNCKLESGDSDPVVWFDNVENGRLEQCEITGGANGFHVSAARDCSAVENSFYGGWIGIRHYNTSNSLVIDNRIHNNQRGILLERAEYCDILNNSIYSNLQYGIEITSYSYNNSIYGNSIGWNDFPDRDERNAIDSGEDNSFDDGSSIGNFWSDFNESETYQIPGTGSSIDAFAQILEDDVGPIIVPLDDTAIDVDTSGNTLTWSVYDQFPESYVVQENEVETISTVWNEGEITFGLDHLRVGTHSITIVLYDGAGNNASDGVFVTVVSFILGGIGTELVLIASGITVASFVVVILLIKKLS